MNVYDSERVAGLLTQEGYELTAKLNEADVILYNTCSVRELAEHKAVSTIGTLAGLKRRRPEVVLGIIGCMAQNRRKELFQQLPHVDLLCGPQNLVDVPRLIQRARQGERRLMALDRGDYEVREEIKTVRRESQHKAWITIIEGCNYACSYCIVPRVRGKEISRSSSAILEEAKQLEEQGYQELTLLGQTVNAYYDPAAKIDFVDLLALLANRVRIPWIRFMTSHPGKTDRRLFEAIREYPNLCEHLHLPFQSGCDRILKEMRREYTREKYLELTREYRQVVPGGTLTTDVIVGFPTETEEEFQQTVSLMEEVEFDDAFLYKFSPRKGTLAAKVEDDIPREIKEERHQILCRVQDRIKRKRVERFVGTYQEVLLETKSKKDEGCWVGRTRGYHKCVVQANPDLLGRIVDVKITGVEEDTLRGEITGDGCQRNNVGAGLVPAQSSISFRAPTRGAPTILGISFFVFCFLSSVFCFLSSAHAVTHQESLEWLLLQEDYETLANRGESLSRDYPQAEYFYLSGLGYLKESQFDKARGQWSELVQHFPRSPQRVKAEIGVADSYYLEGKNEEALTRYLELHKKERKGEFHPYLLYRLGQCYQKTGNQQDSQWYFEQVQQRYPNSPEARWAKTKLKEGTVFSVQVGAFSNRRNAYKMERLLSEKGFRCYVVESVDGGLPVYRVRVGKLATQREAQRLRAQLTEHGFSTKIFP
ncbi:MAG: tRNA (N6-isopentenyl adenosine(37)-C2)-methylthiotransferase MiaB [Candidatus Omnitrophica bacterium]|nr:tRNA (N6-isopentenyl adenosine(37)-C2)-methylthiotransferase MiaB [Candidatus Omnitrophota bacterium]